MIDRSTAPRFDTIIAPTSRTSMPLIAPRPPAKPTAGPPSLRGLEQVAWLMDRAVRIPGTRITVGLDSILGLLPIGGDVLTGVVQAGLVLLALFRYRVPRPVAARMAANVLIDVLIGAVPLVGDLFDVAFKANTRNMELLKQVVAQPEPSVAATSRTSMLYLVGIAALLFLVLGLVLIGFITVVGWLLHRPLV